MRHLSSEEEARLRDVLEKDWPGHIPELKLALHTGLRISEMYGLTWENVNLSQRLLTISPQICKQVDQWNCWECRACDLTVDR